MRNKQGNYNTKRAPFDLYYRKIKGRDPEGNTLEIATEGMEPKIDFGNKLGSLVVEFYQAVVPIIQTYAALEPYEAKQRPKKGMKTVINFVKRFVEDNRWIITRFKTIFSDMDEMVLDRIVGNTYLLDCQDIPTEQIIAWFLIHYTTQTTEEVV